MTKVESHVTTGEMSIQARDFAAENKLKISMRKHQLKKTQSHGSLPKNSPRLKKGGKQFDDWLAPNEKTQKHAMSMEVENYGTNNRYENTELKQKDKVNILGGIQQPKQNITSMHETTLLFRGPGQAPEKEPEEASKGAFAKVTRTKVRKAETVNPEQEEVKIIKNHFKNQYRIFDGKMDYWKNLPKTAAAEFEKRRPPQVSVGKGIDGRPEHSETKKVYYNKEGPGKTIKTTVVRRVLKTLNVKPKDPGSDSKKQSMQTSILKNYFTKPENSQSREIKFHSKTNNPEIVNFEQRRRIERESMENELRQRSLDQLKNINRSISNFQSTVQKRSLDQPSPNRFQIVNRDAPHGLASNDYMYMNRAGPTNSEEELRQGARGLQQPGGQWSHEVLMSTLKKQPHYRSKYLSSNHTSNETLQSPLRRGHRSVSPYGNSGVLESPLQNRAYNFPRAARQNKPFTQMPSKQLPLINELQLTSSNMPLSTYSNAHMYIPSGVNDLLLLLMKKILVYSSKVEGLQAKLLENNPLFNGMELLADIKLINRQFLTLHDMVYFVHCFGFRVSDWEAFRMMCYLSHYTLASLAELVIQENIDETSIKLIPQDYFENRRMSSVIQGETEPKLLAVTEERPKYYISPADLLHLIMPGQRERARQSLAGQARLDERKIRKREYFLIRQILLLTFRKIEEIGMIIHHIRKYNLGDIFGFLSDFGGRVETPRNVPRPNNGEVTESSGRGSETGLKQRHKASIYQNFEFKGCNEKPAKGAAGKPNPVRR